MRAVEAFFCDFASMKIETIQTRAAPLPDDLRLMDLGTVAEALELPVSTVRELVRRGDLRATEPVARRWRVSVAELRRFVRARRFR